MTSQDQQAAQSVDVGTVIRTLTLLARLTAAGWVDVFTRRPRRNAVGYPKGPR